MPYNTLLSLLFEKFTARTPWAAKKAKYTKQHH